MTISVEMIPLMLTMLVVVPLTFDVIREILEEKLKFQLVISTYVLRALELVFALMIFPSALIFILCSGFYCALNETCCLSHRFVDFIAAPKIIQRACYFMSQIIAYLGMLVLMVVTAQFVYSSL